MMISNTHDSIIVRLYYKIMVLMRYPLIILCKKYLMLYGHITIKSFENQFFSYLYAYE